MKKKIVLTSSVLLLIGISIYHIYGTLATDVSSSEGEVYNFNISEDNSTVTVPANSYKTVFLKIKNTNDGTVRYGISYTNHSNIEVLSYNNGLDEMTGLIKKNEYKFIKLRVVNNTSSSQSTMLTPILGYENGGDLIVPSDKKLVSEEYTSPEPLQQKLNTYITNLYNSANKMKVTNNSIEYNYASSVNLMNDRLGGTTISLDGGNIRYYGANPNNYIYFNCSDYNNQTDSTCELWRIIGVFDGKVKIIRNESIGNYSWDNKDTSTGAETNEGKNDWTTARLMKLLNSEEYYTLDDSDTGDGLSLYWYSESGMCFSEIGNATVVCDFTSTGIKNNITRSMITEVTWNLGGRNNPNIYSNQIYGYERGTTVYTGRPTTWTGKIGLMYPSDYGYATDFNSCSKSLYNYKREEGCTVNDWLFNSTYQWLLNSNADYANDAWSVVESGHSFFSYVGYALAVRPVLYLNSETIIESGNSGSSSDPYRINVS